MDDLAQALAKLAEADAIGQSMASYMRTERILGEAPTIELLPEVVSNLAQISALHHDVLALIVRHLSVAE